MDTAHNFCYKKKRFLCYWYMACRESGVPVHTAESWDFHDRHGFKKRRALADRSALGVVEAEVHRRAIEGIDHPVIHQGVITDTYKTYSDNLLMFRAKRLDPSYRDNHDDRARENIPAQTVINIIVPPGAEPPQQVVREECAGCHQRTAQREGRGERRARFIAMD